LSGFGRTARHWKWRARNGVRWVFSRRVFDLLQAGLQRCESFARALTPKRLLDLVQPFIQCLACGAEIRLAGRVGLALDVGELLFDGGQPALQSLNVRKLGGAFGFLD